MNASAHGAGVALAAAAAALALASCGRNADTGTATTASTTTDVKAASPGAIVANTPTASVNPAAPPLTGFDKTFATSAAEGGMFEVEVGKLARDKASDQAVKAFAQKLVDDHGTANDKLRGIAAMHSLALPSNLPPEKQKELDRLSKLSGAEFDKAFIQVVGLKDHETDIALFEKASREVKSNDLRDFAKAALSTLHDHLSTATKLPASGKS